MQVRLKLDTCGVKLKLQHWHQFSQQERQHLAIMSCRSPLEVEAYYTYLQRLVKQYTGEPAKELAIAPDPPWLNASAIPEELQAKAAEFGVEIARSQWATLTPLQRFALIKLSRPSHENRNFYPALQEFGLA